ncbi:ParM/StbA family protein [Oryzomonas sagensis]|uniref:ParM/StbA family protein n=1 Tax=Oryzomonas sagensis TaxID=2603857 RepID=A0ABQ6TLE8_9BACT|nr:ParM/StbA family protein [Oryzomonas sagensis]KAB0669011.1 ParM/StbA family protein [Oryzomonas sagensis]
MKQTFVVDLGFSSAKIMTDDDIKYRILSVYQHSAGRVLVGDDALNHPGGVAYLRTPQHLVEYYPAFVNSALDTVGVDATIPVDLAVGLPAQFWEDQQGAGGAIETLQRTLISDRVGSVTVLPQGLGGLKSIDLSQIHQGGLLLGIDIGHNTVIVTLFDPRRGAVVASKTLYKRGVCQMVENHLAPRITSFTSGLATTPVELAKIAELGFIQAGLDRHDLTPEINAAAEEYCKVLLDEIIEDMRGFVSIANPISQVAYFGGGAVHFANIGLNSDNRIPQLVLPDPVFANARGFLEFLRGSEAA